MHIKGNLWKIRLFHIINEFLLVLPIIVIFWLLKKLTIAEVFWLQSIFAIAVLILEIPSGYFADKFGRKTSLVIGSTLIFLSFTGYIFGENFAHFAMIEIIMGIGISLISGADSALLYDTLIELGREDEYHKIESKYFSLSSYAQGIAAIIGGFMAVNYMHEAFILQAGVLFLLIPLTLSLKETTIHKEQFKLDQKDLKEIVKYSLHEHKEIKWLVLYAGFLSASTLAAVWFAQPFWQHLEIPLSLFGIIWAALSIWRGIAAHFGPKFKKILGRKNALIALIFLPLIGYLGIGIFQNFQFAIIFFLFFQATFALSSPVLKDYINKLVSSDMRATVLSVKSMMERLAFAIIGPLLGWGLDVLSFREAFLMSGVAFFIAGIICLIMLKKHKVLGK